MVHTICDWDSYKTPSNTVLKNRREFYSLQRKRREPTDQWLSRVKSCIRHCEFPTTIEFLLIDRFVCELNGAELKIIQSANTWTLNQLLECFLDKNNDTGNIEANSAVDENVNQNQNIPLDIVKSEPVCLSLQSIQKTQHIIYFCINIKFCCCCFFVCRMKKLILSRESKINTLHPLK